MTTGREQLIQDEGGHVLTMYLDTVGKHTIGVGHNLDAKPISQYASEIIFDDDYTDAVADLHTYLPWAARLSEDDHAVLVNMAFNLGIGGLLKFTKFLEALRLGDHARAAAEMLNSKWAHQVGPRALRLVNIVQHGG